MEADNQIRIGCPVWNCPGWRGKVYSPKSPRKNWLREYSRVFSTVEGNSTFYGIPAADTFKRWADETPDGFRFVLKFPRVISHEHQLVGAEKETDLFLERVDILHDAGRLGPSFLQLGPSFGPSRLNQLEEYLKSLPSQFPYAVEVRHPDFFDAANANQLNSLLEDLQIDRVIFDSRPLFSSPATDELELAAQKRKPNVPVHTHVTGKNPILRLIGRNQVAAAQEWIDQWILTASRWQENGMRPYLFAHTPDDQFAAALAFRFMSEFEEETRRVVLMNKPVRHYQRTLF